MSTLVERLHERDATIERLQKRVERLEYRLNRIKYMVTGDATPRWDVSVETTRTRGLIADLCKLEANRD
jgi:hypothetical protein